MKTSLRLLLWAAAPFYLYAHSNGLPIERTSTMIDGGLTCTQCHTGGTNGSGRVTLIADAYTPGIAQTILVQIERARWRSADCGEHPWGCVAEWHDDTGETLVSCPCDMPRPYGGTM